MADIFKFLRAVRDCLFPVECFRCQKSDVYCCQECLARVHVRPKFHLIDTVHIFSAYAYADSTVRTLIHDYKYHHITLARAPLEKLLYRWALQSGHLIPEDCVLVPVPLHPHKLMTRGYNQAEMMAQYLGALLDIPVASHVLFRVRNDMSQTEASERKTNTTGAFKSRENFHEKVFLVDDVLTSGSTMLSCLSALAEQNITCLGGVTLAWGSDSSKNSTEKS